MSRGAVPSAYADCIHVRCPHCEAEPNSYCQIVVNAKFYDRHCPCKDRLRASTTQTSSEPAVGDLDGTTTQPSTEGEGA